MRTQYGRPNASTPPPPPPHSKLLQHRHQCLRLQWLALRVMHLAAAKQSPYVQGVGAGIMVVPIRPQGVSVPCQVCESGWDQQWIVALLFRLQHWEGGECIGSSYAGTPM